MIILPDGPHRCGFSSRGCDNVPCLLSPQLLRACRLDVAKQLEVVAREVNGAAVKRARQVGLCRMGRARVVTGVPDVW